MMNIYFCGSIAGGRKYLAAYQKIVSYLKSRGHRILTEHVVQPNVLELEEKLTPEQIYTRDIDWLKECDCVIAEVSNPSLGVGYEICYALRLNKPVLCLYRQGIFLTRMLTGNTSAGIVVEEYHNDADGQKHIDRFTTDLLATNLLVK
jgi:nucleoside 2-deoxyribosyltransferase